jgi:Arc/MetJ family transcription regulator
MVTHMKTTIEITAALLAEAKRLAAREGITVRTLVEQGLRQAIRERRKRTEFRLRKATFRGEGLQPGVADRGWEHARELAYEGRGG